jgi:hypothetical protein
VILEQWPRMMLQDNTDENGDSEHEARGACEVRTCFCPRFNLFGDQRRALQASLRLALRNVLAPMNANGCRRWVEVGPEHERIMCLDGGRFKDAAHTRESRASGTPRHSALLFFCELIVRHLI